MTDDPRPLNGDSAADGYNAGYAERLYERELRDRGLIPPSLADWVGGVRTPAAAPPAATSVVPSAQGVAPVVQLRLAAIAGALVEAYRDYGHLASSVDPLGSSPPRHPMLDPAFHGVTVEDLASIPASAVQLERLGSTAGEALSRLEGIYCSTIGYELDHMENPAQRDWLIDYIESDRHRQPLAPERASRLLERLTRVEGLEQFLHRSYLGKKRFSIEGLDMLIPMMMEVLRGAGRRGARKVFLGMAHRGRLNVLAHILGTEYRAILAEFEEEITDGIQTNLPETGSGDVKYHVGGRRRVSEEEIELDVYLAPNPSHLEHVNPVVLGMARAARFVEDVDDPEAMLPILIHGDASFAGQGVVAETLNMCRLPAYEVGGTIHLIANNQLGFTTLPEESRSTRYASDLALGFRIPVIHVNADDPEACMGAARLAVEYRFEFGEDIVIDLVGYRRYGHNEGDEPGYTQPIMYRRIAEHPTVRAQWAERLVADGVLSAEDATRMSDEVAASLNAARDSIKRATTDEVWAASADGPDDPSSSDGLSPGARLTETERGPVIQTGIEPERLEFLNRAIHAWPESFQMFHKLGRQLEKRRDALASGIDWAHAEALALASLLVDGTPIRMTGEDTERGTFSHRHLVLHDSETGETFTPLANLTDDQATFEIANSPLSEVAVLAFEYGFSTIAQEALVLWEAQFGDFVNVGQAIIDQFIVAGRSKWGQESRLVLLLPHGHEGQGPEHSSARPERFLQLAAQGDIRVCNCSTPAQYFHLLRLQALRPDRRPLIVMTPKSLLRSPRARSDLSEMQGLFRPVLGDESASRRAQQITRAVVCSGKIYYDLTGSDEAEAREDVAVIRVEQLYPFPARQLEEALAEYPKLEQVRWVQEEPANMGAWSYMSPWLGAISADRWSVGYVGRAAKASPAEGYAGKHARRQAEIVTRAFQD